MDRQNCHCGAGSAVRQQQTQPRRLSITLHPELKQLESKKVLKKMGKPSHYRELDSHEIAVLNKLARLVWKRLNYSLQQMQKRCITESDYCLTLESFTGNVVFDLGRSEKGMGLLSGWLGMRVQNQLIWAFSQLKTNANGKPRPSCNKYKG